MDPAQLQERILGEVTTTVALYGLYFGKEMGWLESVAQNPNTTAEDLAARTGTVERYCQEWLDLMATCGYITLREDTYSMPETHKPVLVGKDSPFSCSGLFNVVPSMAAVIGDLKHAYKHGGGVDFSKYTENFLHLISDVNKHFFENELVPDWLSKMTELNGLQTQKGRKILDVGCGLGISSIVMARSYPNAVVDAVEPDQRSWELAREKLAREVQDVQNRVNFQCNFLENAGFEEKSFDLITFFECLHDISDPVEVLKCARKLVKPESGVVVIADEKAWEKTSEMVPKSENGNIESSFFKDPSCSFGRLLFGFSFLHCLPCSMVDPKSRAVGAAIRASQVEAFAKEAGFSGFEVVGETAFKFRIYKLAV